jgi:signal transduction histidine kinase
VKTPPPEPAGGEPLRRRHPRPGSDDFISIVAHEMRSPLLFVRQCMRLLLAGDVGRIDEAARGVLESAANRTELALSLVTNWLTLSRIGAADLLGEVSTVALAEVVEAVVERAREDAGARSIEILVDHADPDVTVRGEAAHITLIVRNLVDNAIKYNRDEGTVRIRTAVDTDRVILTVTDSGIGIAEDDLPHLFDEFFRSTSLVPGKIVGTGLGLSIVKRLVHGYGGEVHVRSEPGTGSEFRVVLPAGQGA